VNQAPSQYMARALALADSALGSTSPNPSVGCVIVKNGIVIGEGHTLPPGQAHAEVVALRQAGDNARGATVYVTLEPCSHYGRTPPCADALIEAGVSRVIYAIDDPDDRVAGRGAARLRQSGIEVQSGDGAAESARLLEAYLKHRRTGLPFVIVKYAATLDGRLSAGSGDSRWVSGPETLRWAHTGRTKLDAIMVGSSTVVIDNPQLTARPDGVPAQRQLLRIVADSTGRIPPTARVLDGASKTLVATTDRSPEAWRRSIAATGAEVLVGPSGPDGRVSLPALLSDLGSRGVLSLLVEGGGVLHGSFFDQRLVDKVTIVIAPMVLGAGAMAVEGRAAQYMRDAVHLRDLTVERLGEDTLYTGYPVYPTA